MEKKMRKLFIVLGVLILLLVAAVLILPSLVPSSVYKSRIEEQISTSLGRKVDIAGDVKLSVFPTLKAKAKQVTIANADGFTPSYFAKMDTLEAGVKLLPLLSKKVEITKFNLVNADINLTKAKSGDVNWAFGTPEKPSKPAANSGPFRRDGRYADLDLSLGAFSLKNGS
ncbi:MAG TPA: AsmA family protein, partial [Hellea balneolensis]|nr:AsmA family protein [Hellea balneolensis]